MLKVTTNAFNYVTIADGLSSIVFTANELAPLIEQLFQTRMQLWNAQIVLEDAATKKRSTGFVQCCKDGVDWDDCEDDASITETSVVVHAWQTSETN